MGSSKVGQEAQTGKPKCVKLRNYGSLKNYYHSRGPVSIKSPRIFPAPGFIASLLWEQEPRRLFNIISSSQYIIPRQILVHLRTSLTFMDREQQK